MADEKEKTVLFLPSDNAVYKDPKEVRRRFRHYFSVHKLDNFAYLLDLVPDNHVFDLSPEEEATVDNELKRLGIDRSAPIPPMLERFLTAGSIKRRKYLLPLDISSEFCKCGSRVLVRFTKEVGTARPFNSPHCTFFRASGPCTCDSRQDLKLELQVKWGYQPYYEYYESARIHRLGFEIGFHEFDQNP